jgi:methyl acetate hydrolase
MSRKTVEAAATAGVAAAALAGTAGAQRLPGSAAIDDSLSAAVERKDVPGVVALVTDRGRLLYQGAFGVADVATGRPLAQDALFRIASMTKPITSVALMQFVEQGRIGLDDAAEKYLPELADLKVFESFDPATGAYKLRPAARPATVSHFLTHTAGLAYPFTSEIWRDFKPAAGETYPFGGPLLFDPGERWHYSTSTDVVGRLVEVVSGKKLEDYFREHIFVPLGMNDTSYDVPDAKGPRLVAQQQRSGERMDGVIVLQQPQLGLTIAAPVGGGGLASTAEDYGRFLRMWLNGGELEGKRVLKAETVALMGQNHIGAVSVPAQKSALPRSADFTFIADNRDKWGLGFLITADQVAGKRSPGSLSWGGINNTYFWIDPTLGIAGVIMMQFLPFADAKALAVHDAFERGAYRLVGAGR